MVAIGQPLTCRDITLKHINHDLSVLSAKLVEEQLIQIECKSKVLKIKVGKNPDFQLTYNEEIGALKVIKFIFMGYGEVSKFKMY